MTHVVIALIVLVFSFGPGSRASTPSDGMWLRPVPGALVVPFDGPRVRWEAGHRGVDLAAPPGTPVRAANAGVVTFAGAVTGTLHVVVRHPNGLRTGYSFLADVAVHPGMVVARGAVLGHSGGPGDSAHDATVLHLSLRAGTRYRDPMVLFAPVDLGAVVHLAPL